MRFENLDPWPEAVPLIELVVQGSTFDLHNWGEFVGFSFETPDSLSVRFRHWGPDGDRGEQGTAIGMRFRAVRDLVVTQAPDFEHRVAGDLDHWLAGPRWDPEPRHVPLRGSGPGVLRGGGLRRGGERDVSEGARSALEAAGWRPGREVDVAPHVAALRSEGYAVWPGDQDTVWFDPARAVEPTFPQWVSWYEDQLHERLAPIGYAYR